MGRTHLVNQAIDLANQGPIDARAVFLEQWERQLNAQLDDALDDAQAALRAHARRVGDA
jgi:hypothetical protein